MIIEVQVAPRSSRNKVIKLQDNTYKVYVTSPPVGGEANKKIIELLSKELGVPKSRLEIIRGVSSRKKQIKIDE